MPAPIVLFVYNRPWHTKQTLESLSKNDLASESELFIYADGPKANASNEVIGRINEVRKMIREKNWCKAVHIFESESNRTLPVILLEKVTEIINKFGKVIVLEDDLLLTAGFLKYMNEALDLYEEEGKVMHVSGYMYPVRYKMPEIFFLRIPSCWGWGTWKRAWDQFDLSAERLLSAISKQEVTEFDFGYYPFYEALQRCAKGPWRSWDIRWYASVFVNGGLCLHPGRSLVQNIGFDGSGVHCDESKVYYNRQLADGVNVSQISIERSSVANEALVSFFKKLHFGGSQAVHELKHLSRKILRIFTVNSDLD